MKLVKESIQRSIFGTPVTVSGNSMEHNDKLLTSGDNNLPTEREKNATVN